MGKGHAVTLTSVRLPMFRDILIFYVIFKIQDPELNHSSVKVRPIQRDTHTDRQPDTQTDRHTGMRYIMLVGV